VVSAVPIAGLEPRAFEGRADCELIAAPVSPSGDAITIDTDDETGVRVSRSAAQPERVTFEYADGTRFLVEDRGRRITTSWTTTTEDMATYFLGPVLAFVLRSRGTLALHASAVAMQGRAIVLTAAATGGKSTTAAALVRNGATMLTDDVAAVEWRDGVPFVQPGYPRLRVWPDVATALYGSEDALPLLTPSWTKRYIDARQSFASIATPIAAIAVLVGRDATRTRIRELHGHEAAMALLARTSVPHLLAPHERIAELEEITRLVSHVRVLEIVANDDLTRTDALATQIADATAIR
jgi:hypothetical protein